MAAGPVGPAVRLSGACVPATVHLLTAPPGPALTARLFAAYLEAVREPGAALWLTPSDRAADETLRRLAAVGRPVLQPHVYSLARFAEAVLGRGPAAPWVRRLVLDEVAAELTQQGRIP